jgi:hypothetical protein
MGKITVKHYLEKKVKPEIIFTNIVSYPLYVQITINRKTTQIKSLTEALMSEKAFEIYNNTGKVHNYETNILGNSPFLKIENETKLIENSIYFLEKIYNKTYNLSKKRVREHLEKMLSNAMDCLIYSAWLQDTYGDPNIDWFLSAFNKKSTMLENIKKINEVLKIDLADYLPKDFFKTWQTIELTKFVKSREITFIEFVNENYIEIMTKSLNEKKVIDFCLISKERNLTKKEIEDIMPKLIKRYILCSIEF